MAAGLTDRLWEIEDLVALVDQNGIESSMDTILAANRDGLRPLVSMTRVLKVWPSTVTTRRAGIPGGTARGCLATTDLGEIRASGILPCSPQSSHIFTTGE